MVRVLEFVCFLIKSHFTYSWFQVIPPSDSLTLHVLKGEQAGGQGYHTAEEDSPDSLAKLSAEPSCLGGHSPICLSVPHLHVKPTQFCVFPSWTVLKLSTSSGQRRQPTETKRTDAGREAPSIGGRSHRLRAMWPTIFSQRNYTLLIHVCSCHGLYMS